MDGNQPLQDHPAVQVRHDQVKQDKVIITRGRALQALGPPLGPVDGVPRRGQGAGDRHRCAERPRACQFCVDQPGRLRATSEVGQRDGGGRAPAVPGGIRPPLSLAARTYTDIRRWSVMPHGGHFAALEQPEALANEVREFFRPLRA